MSFVHLSLLKRRFVSRSIVFWCTISLLINFILGVVTFISLQNQKIIVIPPHSQATWLIRDDAVNQTYLENFAMYFAQLLGSIDAHETNYAQRTLLRYATPEAARQLEKSWLELRKRNQDQSYRTAFYPRHLSVDPEKLIAKVQGTQYVTMDNQDISTHSIRFTFHFVMDASRLWLTRTEQKYTSTTK